MNRGIGSIRIKIQLRLHIGLLSGYLGNSALFLCLLMVPCESGNNWRQRNKCASQLLLLGKLGRHLLKAKGDIIKGRM